MREKFHRELEELKEEVEEMGNLSAEMLRHSVIALKERNVKLAEEVISKKNKLAEMDNDIEEKALELIALYQPMARDMRTIGCILKIITYLTRIGRYGKDIANITKEFLDTPHIAKLVEIPYMAELVNKMINDALKAFRTEDISQIQDFSERDDSIDSLYYSIFRECITYMMENQKNITRCMHYILIARYLERCADHACKIAEKIYYMVTGERIEIK